MRRTYRIGFVLAIFAALLASPTDRTEAATETIQKGIHIGNIDVGGMTAGQASIAVEQYVQEIRNSTFILNSTKGSMELSAQEMGVEADVQTSVQKALEAGNTGNLIERFKEQKRLENGVYTIAMPVTIDRKETANRIYENRLELGTPSEDNSLVRENGAFRFVEGKSGEEVDIVESVYAIEDYLANWKEGDSKEISLVTKMGTPRGSQEELSKVKDVLGSFTTDFSSSSYERATNVKTGVSKINGTILYPGDEFSVYETVSPFTKENGYELAGSYANGTVVESFGGGICQVSTTLYNAVIRAELEVIQRYNHSMSVSYVKPSEDAAIAGTYKDMRFRNSLSTPIYIQGYCEGGVIYFNIYGEETRPANREVRFESEIIQTIEPKTTIETTSSHDLGYISVSNGSHTGYEAQLMKVVLVDGAEQSREVFNKSTYKPSSRVMTVGTNGATKEQLASIRNAVSSGDEGKVRDAVNAAKAAGKDTEATETEQEAGEKKDKTDKKSDKTSDKTSDKGSGKKDTGSKKSESSSDSNNGKSSKKTNPDDTNDPETTDDPEEEETEEPLDEETQEDAEEDPADEDSEAETEEEEPDAGEEESDAGEEESEASESDE